MAGSDHRTVNIKGDPVKGESTCAAILTVGQVVEDAATVGVIQASSVASAIYPGGRMVVTEAPEQGKGIYSSGTTENTYAIGAQVPWITLQPGNEVLVLLTSGQTITRGNELEVASGGKVIVGAGTNRPAFTALESLSPAQDALIHVRVL